MIIIDYVAFKAGLLKACQNYLDGKTLVGDPDGFIHTKAGRDRAENLKIYLTTFAQNNEDVLTAAVAVCADQPITLASRFFSNFGFYPGASARLAGLVGEELIRGRCIIVRGEVMDSLSSSVFSAAGMDKANCSEAMSVAAFRDVAIAQFRKSRGLRILIDAELETLPAEQAARIRARALVLQQEWVKPAAEAQNLLGSVVYPVPMSSSSSSSTKSITVVEKKNDAAAFLPPVGPTISTGTTTSTSANPVSFPVEPVDAPAVVAPVRVPTPPPSFEEISLADRFPALPVEDVENEAVVEQGLLPLLG